MLENDQYQSFLKKGYQGNSLEGLKTHGEWNALVEVFKGMYLDALQVLCRNESVEARARVQAIEDLFQMIDNTILIGKEAREILASEQFKNQGRNTA